LALVVRQVTDAVQFARELQGNALALLEEAQILFEHGRWARALALAVLAEEEAGKALLTIREQLPGDDFGDLKANRHEDKLTAMALTELAFRGDLRDFQERAGQIDTGTLHREKLAALYVDFGPSGLQSPRSVTPERAEHSLSVAGEIIGWVRTHLGQISVEAIEAAILLDGTMTPTMEQYEREYGPERALELARQMVAWGLAQTSGASAAGDVDSGEA
jgi:AbiV family abortive infection protein